MWFLKNKKKSWNSDFKSYQSFDVNLLETKPSTTKTNTLVKPRLRENILLKRCYTAQIDRASKVTV